MKQTLLTSDTRQFNFLMLGDESVVRNFKKINALFEIHLSDYQPRLRYILAQPEFEGTKNNEKIHWTTELFGSKPVKLSSLNGEDRVKYRRLLSKELDAIKEVLQSLPTSVAVLLQKAVTYHSEDTVYCGEDAVVITEWGMHPKESSAINAISLDLGFIRGVAHDFLESKELKKEEELIAETNVTVPTEDGEKNTSVGQNPPEPEGISDTPNEAQDTVEIVEKPINNEKDGMAIPDDHGKKKCHWLWWLLLLIPLLLLLSLLRKCGSENIDTPPPPIEDDDLEWSDDSLSRIVNNRLILLFSDEFSTDDFVKDFRKKYPNKKKYQLYVPDELLPRVVLSLPSEELESMSNGLPDEFSKYDLMVIPESIFEGNKFFNDPAFDDTVKSWYFDMISVEKAWPNTIGSSDVVVAIIDDGFDLNHPELKGKEIVKPYNAVNHSNKVFPNPTSGHGTHVASTAVGIANNNEGSAGIAPNCKLMPIQVADANGFMATSSIVDGVLYAISQKADVVNMSLGKVINPIVGKLPDKYQEEIVRTSFLEEEQMWKKIFAMGMSRGKDMAFVLAGGNQNLLIGVDPMQRVNGTIRVSAVMPNKLKAEFSNFGIRSDLSAPGVNIYNAVSGSQKYATMSGTSMASPIVAGAFALIKSCYPTMKTAEIKALLQHTGMPSMSKVGNIINFADAFSYMGNNPDLPSDPGSPLNPTNPSNPSNPLNPSNPDSPLNPLNPTSPLNPDNPKSPLNPQNPNNPISPTDPNRSNPRDPNNPYNPNNPISPLNPSNPESPLNPTNPKSPLNPDNPRTPLNPDDPNYSMNPMDPDDPMNPGNPKSPFNPKNPDSPLNPSNPESPLNPTNPSNPSNPLNPNNPDSPLNPSNPKSPLNPSNPKSPLNPRNPNNPISPTDPNRSNPMDPNNPYNPNNPTNPISPKNPNSPLNPNNPDSPLNPKNPDNPYSPNPPDFPSNPKDPNSPWNPTNPNSPLNPKNPNSPLNPKNPKSPLNPDYPGNVISPHPIDPDDPCPDCTEAQRSYQELMRQLEELKRKYPGCY